MTYITQFYIPRATSEEEYVANISFSDFFIDAIYNTYLNEHDIGSDKPTHVLSYYRESLIGSLTHTAFPTALAIMPATTLNINKNTDQLHDLGFGEWLVTSGKSFIVSDISAIELYRIYKTQTDNLGPMLFRLKLAHRNFFNTLGNYYGNVYNHKAVCWGQLASKPLSERTIDAYYNSGFNLDLSSWTNYMYNAGRAKLRRATVDKDGRVDVLKDNGQGIDYTASVENCNAPLSSYATIEQINELKNCSMIEINKTSAVLNNTLGQKIAENIIVNYLLTDYKRIPGVTLTLNFHVSIY